MSKAPILSEKDCVIQAFFAISTGSRSSFQFEMPRRSLWPETSPGVICGLTYLAAGSGPEVKPVQAEATFSFSKAFLLGESLILTFDVTSSDGKSSHLDWAFSPVRFTSFGAACVGLSDQIMIVDPHHNIHKIHMQWLGPVDPEYRGSRSFRFGCYPGRDRQAYKDVTFETRRRRNTTEAPSSTEGSFST